MITTAYTLPLRCIKLRSTAPQLLKKKKLLLGTSLLMQCLGTKVAKVHPEGMIFLISSMQTLYSISTDRSLQSQTRLALHTELTFSLLRRP